jgi:hypothetical protein
MTRPSIDEICERESFNLAIQRDMLYGEDEAEKINDEICGSDLDSYCEYYHLKTNIWDEDD